MMMMMMMSGEIYFKQNYCHILSNKVCRLHSSSVLLSKFPNIIGDELHLQFRNFWHVYPGFLESIKNSTLS